MTRSVRVTVAACGLLALCFKVIGSPQMALFATFRAFATQLTAYGDGAADLPPELLQDFLDRVAGRTAVTPVDRVYRFSGNLVVLT